MQSASGVQAIPLAILKPMVFQFLGFPALSLRIPMQPCLTTDQTWELRVPVFYQQIALPAHRAANAAVGARTVQPTPRDLERACLTCHRAANAAVAERAVLPTPRCL